MGLTIFYDLRYPADRSRDEAFAAVCALRERAMTFSFDAVSPVFDLSHGEHVDSDANFLRFCAEILANPARDDELPHFTGVTESAFGFTVDPGARCETATFGLIRRRAEADGDEEWYWWSGPKTQYASLVSEQYFVDVHTRLIAVLDAAVELGFEVDVRDGGGYWASRSVEDLVRSVRHMNHVVARITGVFSDAIGPAAIVESPILDHPEFERLEMKEEDGG
jgi:hypothetical protein